ncbi:MAG: acyl carrier protein [Burkholderiales bacterium]|nr:acyl carrier protein [Burkholderiales bacterium]
MLEEIVKHYLIHTKDISPAKFSEPDLQVAALGLDSLDMVEMLFEVEDRCGFQLNDPMRYLKMSFAGMLADIESQIREHNNGTLPELSLESSK